MKNYKIMAVDDEKIILESIKDYLYEYNVNTFINSKQALNELMIREPKKEELG